MPSWAVTRRCVAVVNPHLSADMQCVTSLRAPLLTTRCMFFNTLGEACECARVAPGNATEAYRTIRIALKPILTAM